MTASSPVGVAAGRADADGTQEGLSIADLAAARVPLDSWDLAQGPESG
jgi:hypothetical protein